jgi:hypothetical protein
MTPSQAKDTAEEIAPWTLDDRRAYLANLAVHSGEDAELVKAALKEIWKARGK